MSNKLPETWKELVEWAKQYGWGLEFQWDDKRAERIECLHNYLNYNSPEFKENGYMWLSGCSPYEKKLSVKQMAIIIQALEGIDE